MSALAGRTEATTDEEHNGKSADSSADLDQVDLFNNAQLGKVCDVFKKNCVAGADDHVTAQTCLDPNAVDFYLVLPVDNRLYHEGRDEDDVNNEDTEDHEDGFCGSHDSEEKAPCREPVHTN
nr:hypothetical protein HmN_000850700 [Hymenolepis microstoma]